MAETPSPPRLLLPDVPALVAGQGRAVLLDSDGSIETLPARAVAARLVDTAPLLVHAPAMARRLGVPGIAPAHDLLELFAFVLPAASCAPRRVAWLWRLACPCRAMMKARSPYCPISPANCCAASRKIVRRL